MVKKRLEEFVSKMELSVEHILALQISKELIQADQDVVVVFVYIHHRMLCTTETMTLTAI